MRECDMSVRRACESDFKNMKDRSRDLSPVRSPKADVISLHQNGQIPTKMTIHAYLLPRDLSQTLFVRVADEDMTQEEYDMIVAWRKSKNIHNDYLCKFSADDKPILGEWPKKIARDETLPLIPKTREESKKHRHLWKRLFVRKWILPNSLIELEPVHTLALRIQDSNKDVQT